MYRKKEKNSQREIKFVCLEDLVPENHILREIDRAIDFDFIYEEVKGLYKEEEWGKPGIDPVSLFKIVFIQYLFGIRSMRQTIKDIEVNTAYRWFIGFDLFEPIPHFTTFGKNYSRRFKDTDIFERIFYHILEEAVRCGFVDASAIFIDGTHIKASANKKKNTKSEIEVEVKAYQKALNEEINAQRKEHGKKPFDFDDDDTPPPTKNITTSTTDPECGLFHKGEHEKQFAYVSNTACDKNAFVLGFTAAPGNKHDSTTFHDVFEEVTEKFAEIEAVAVDAGYKTPAIAKAIIDKGIAPCMPKTRPMTQKGFFKKYDYVYDEFHDCFICPNNKALKFSTVNRDGYREFKSNPEDCKVCSLREQCTHSKNCQKTVTQHVWWEYMEQVHDNIYTPKLRDIYFQRKETIERIFADGKENHNLRYTQMRGLAKVKMQLTLIFACMNLLKLMRFKKRWGMLRNGVSFLQKAMLFLQLLYKKGAYALA